MKLYNNQVWQFFLDNTVSLKNTNKITYKKGKQLSMKIGSTFFFHSIWKICGRRGNPFGGQRAIETEPFYCALIMITHHHISKTRFIHTQIICCKFFVIIWESIHHTKWAFNSTTPSPQHLHITMLSVLGSGKSFIALQDGGQEVLPWTPQFTFVRAGPLLSLV